MASVKKDLYYSKYLRLTTYSFLDQATILKKISKLSKTERKNLIGAKLIGERREIKLKVPEAFSDVSVGFESKERDHKKISKDIEDKNTEVIESD